MVGETHRPAPAMNIIRDVLRAIQLTMLVGCCKQLMCMESVLVKLLMIGIQTY